MSLQYTFLKKISHFLCLLFIFFIIPSSVLYADLDEKPSVQSLIDSQQLSITHNILPDKPVLGEEVTLIITIKTNRWFSGGTRLKPAASEDFLLKQRQELANNSTMSKQGKTWVVQTWELSLFPQSEGVLNTPSVEVNVKINTESGTVSGAYVLQPLALSVSVPDETKKVNHWLASAKFSVESEFKTINNQSLNELQVGEAFTQTINLRADNVLAMMLPVIKTPVIAGLGVYQQPARLKNDNNRGNKKALRTETIDFIVEKKGNYQLPELNFYWWDTQNNKLHKEIIEGIRFTVSGTASADTKPLNDLTFIESYKWATFLLMVALLLSLSYWVFKRRTKRLSGQYLTKRYSKAKLKKLIQQSISQHNWKMTLRWLYLWQDTHIYQTADTLRHADHIKTSEQDDKVEQLFENAYSQKQENTSDLSFSLFEKGFMRGKNKKIISSDDSLEINPR